MALPLLLSVFVVATCGLIYELVCGTLASYLLGDSVTQFSTIIGTYLFAMGVGSYISRFVNKALPSIFVQVELLVGIIGGCSAAVLFLLFDQVTHFRFLLYSVVFSIGALVGLEIPILMRILKEKMVFKDLVSQVLSFDYVGALVASVLFPLIFVPHLGLVRTAFFFGMFNIIVAMWVLFLFGKEIAISTSLRVVGFLALGLLIFGFIYSDRIMEISESMLYPDRIIYAKTTPYQRIIITRASNDFKLYLNGHLQFDSRDEYRYHEALVHPGLASLKNARNVLILGGGDGMAAREALKYDQLNSITLVDLDASMTSIFATSDLLANLNANSLRSKKVKVINVDAYSWLKNNTQQFDFIIVDFPDPTNYSIGKLYSTSFFRLISEDLAPDGYVVVQSTSPILARKSFWCIESTIEAAGFETLPYHLAVPSFGEWGFILAGHRKVQITSEFDQQFRFVDANVIPAMLQFPRDMSKIPVAVNRLNNQALVRYYEEEWSQYAS